MSKTQTLTVDGSKSLDEINNDVSDEEEIYGSLTTIGNANGKTVLTFNFENPTPSIKAKIFRDSDPKPANSTAVCSGSILISSTPTACTAYRANA
jgi:hypothetical protein